MENGVRPRPSRRRKAVLALSALLCAAIAACYLLQPDWLAPVTLAPAWFWVVLGIVPAVLGFRRGQRLWPAVVLVLWIAFAAVFVEEARSLVRGVLGGDPADEWKAARPQGRAVRVVSLNCYGDARSAREVAEFEPDIVLLQESPGEQQLDMLARELFGESGSVLSSGDTSIVARGRIRPRVAGAGSHFTFASVELGAGATADVVSLRLNPPVFRVDFWMPGFWRDHRDNRVKHRRQINDVLAQLRKVPEGTPVIVGGDFNAPPGDAALAGLGDRLADAFLTAGRGWGNTGTSRVPLFRVDQVWAGGRFKPVSVTARGTLHSDHRMVVCDLILEP